MQQKNQKTIKFIYQVAGKTKKTIVLLAVVQMLLAISSVYFAFLLRDIINAAVAGERQRFFSCIIWLLVLVCVQLTARAGKRFLEEYTRSTLENRFKQRLFSTLMEKEYSYVSAVHSGEWMNRLTNDTVVVANGMTDILPGLCGMVVRMAGAAGLILILEPRFWYFLIPGGLLLITLSYSFRKIMKKLHKEVQQQDGILRVCLQESLGSMLVVRSYGVEHWIRDNAAQKMTAHKRARMKKNSFSNLCNTGFGILVQGAYILGIFFCGYGILTGTMSYGTFLAVLQLIGQIQAPFANISGFLPQYYAMLASCERLMSAEDLTDKSTIPRRDLCEIQSIYQRQFEGFGLQDASFTYFPPAQDMEGKDRKALEREKEQMPVVLSGLNLEIKKGEYIAFAGASGCGKSTVLKLLMCLYSLDEGKRYLQLNGRKEELDGSWQKLFAYVPQGNHLMSGSIREIVAFADPAQMQDEARIHRALSIACADDFVKELEQGVDTVLGERGLGLSEGQMQRLAIARAVFSEHPIMMLDECTSALDEQTEKTVLYHLRSMTDKTVLIVTHRSAALDICDKVIDFTENGCQIRPHHSVRR